MGKEGVDKVLKCLLQLLAKGNALAHAALPHLCSPPYQLHHLFTREGIIKGVEGQAESGSVSIFYFSPCLHQSPCAFYTYHFFITAHKLFSLVTLFLIYSGVHYSTTNWYQKYAMLDVNRVRDVHYFN